MSRVSAEWAIAPGSVNKSPPPFRPFEGKLKATESARRIADGVSVEARLLPAESRWKMAGVLPRTQWV